MVTNKDGTEAEVELLALGMREFVDDEILQSVLKKAKPIMDGEQRQLKLQKDRKRRKAKVQAKRLKRHGP